MGAVALVTGVSRYFGARVALELAESPKVSRVIGIDVVPPKSPTAFEFLREDIRGSGLADLLESAAVDTVVHVGVIATPQQAGSRAAMKDINVIGTLGLLAACQRSERVRNLVVKSTAAVYGAGPKDPTHLVESIRPRNPPTSGWAKDSAEVEDYVRDFARLRPGVQVCVLRFANIIGPAMRTAMTSYLSMPLVPTVLGFDPRLQFVHEDDAVSVIHHTVIRNVVGMSSRGVFNVAGSGVVPLSRVLNRLSANRLPVPAALFAAVGKSLSREAWADFSADHVRYLKYGRTLDTTAVEQDLGFRAKHSSWDTVEAFAEAVKHDD